MSVLEIIVLSVLAVGFVYILYVIYSPKKKKEKKPKEKKVKEKKEKKSKKSNAKKDENSVLGKSIGEKKIEPAIKKEGDIPKEQPQAQEEEKELVLQKEPPEKKGEPFRVIRKQSQVKINKQALKSGSRNPSVTKVFEKGKRIDIDENSNGGLVEDAGKEIAKVVEEVNKEKDGVMSDVTSQEIGHFGVREPNFDAVSGEHDFRINAPIGSPNRAPVIGDRTNFGSHLRVTDDNNLSGVMGTGVAKIIEQTEAQTNEIDKKTEEMVRSVKKDILGDIPRFGGMFDYSSMADNSSQNATSAQQKLKNLDAETIMIAEAISKRKGKK